jgi:hypothetical protein
MEGYMRKLIAIIVLFLSSASYSYADGFYVVPVVTEVEVIKEVCTGVSAGEKVFELVGANFGYISEDWATLQVGHIYTTTNGKVVQIVGITGGGPGKYSKYDRYFRLAPSTIPAPENGIKGPFYYTFAGIVTFAKYL